jgi:hypothetical protein
VLVAEHALLVLCAPSLVTSRPGRGAPPGARPRAERQAGVPGRSGTAANATDVRAANGGALDPIEPNSAQLQPSSWMSRRLTAVCADSGSSHWCSTTMAGMNDSGASDEAATGQNHDAAGAPAPTILPGVATPQTGGAISNTILAGFRAPTSKAFADASGLSLASKALANASGASLISGTVAGLSGLDTPSLQRYLLHGLDIAPALQENLTRISAGEWTELNLSGSISRESSVKILAFLLLIAFCAAVYLSPEQAALSKTFDTLGIILTIYELSEFISKITKRKNGE